MAKVLVKDLAQGSIKEKHSKQWVELILKTRAIGSRNRILIRTVYVDDKGSFISYESQRVEVSKMSGDDLDYQGTVQR